MIEITFRNYLTKSVLEEACSKYGAKVNNLVLIRSALNSMYVFNKGLKSYFLRFTHSDYHDRSLVNAETDWVHFLEKNSVGVVSTVESLTGNTVETILCEKGYYSVVCYERARGNHVKKFDWNENLFKKLGQMTGRMHLLAKEYTPMPTRQRKNFYNDNYLELVSGNLTADEPEITEKLFDSVKTIQTIPVTKDTYGIMHNDIHRGNYFLKGNSITLFDFEDCAYSWFAYDIATQLYDALNLNIYKVFQRDSYIQYFLINFMEGYNRENELSEEMMEHLPTFMTLRSIFDYANINNIWDFKNLNHAQKNFADNTRSHIHEGFAYINPCLFA